MGKTSYLFPQLLVYRNKGVGKEVFKNASDRVNKIGVLTVELYDSGRVSCSRSVIIRPIPLYMSGTNAGAFLLQKKGMRLRKGIYWIKESSRKAY
jgi:hypothetical protein